MENKLKQLPLEAYHLTSRTTFFVTERQTVQKD